MLEHYFITNTCFTFTKIKLLKLFGLFISSIFLSIISDMRRNDFRQPCDLSGQDGLR